MRPCPARAHPGPAWPPVPGEPLGEPCVIYLDAMCDAIAAAVAGCTPCLVARGEYLLHQPRQLAAVAATFYAAMPPPEPGVPQPVHTVRRAAVRAASTPYRDFSPVLSAVRALHRAQRAVLLADLLDIGSAILRAAPPPPPPRVLPQTT